MQRLLLNRLIKNYYNGFIFLVLLILASLSVLLQYVHMEISLLRGYPKVFPMLIAVYECLVFALSYLVIHSVRRKNPPAWLILRFHFWHFMFMYVPIALTLPMVSRDFISADWWAVVCSVVILFSLPDLSAVMRIWIMSLPLTALGLFYLWQFLVYHKFEPVWSQPLLALFITITNNWVRIIIYGPGSRAESSGMVASQNDYLKFCRLFKLSAREQDVVGLLLTNQSRKEIAGSLFISEETVKKHIQNIYGKMGVHSRVELYVMFADSCGTSDNEKD